jgi:hypothetical protein
LDSLEAKNFDGSTFNAWFIAFNAKDPEAQALAVRRFRPEFRKAFDAWIATDPEHNPAAPPGPTYMAEYAQPENARGDDLTRQADEHYAKGAEDGEIADDYIRTTILLASVLFIVGISSHFAVRSARYVLIGVASSVLVYAATLLITIPKPPL